MYCLHHTKLWDRSRYNFSIEAHSGPIYSGIEMKTIYWLPFAKHISYVCVILLFGAFCTFLRVANNMEIGAPTRTGGRPLTFSGATTRTGGTWSALRLRTSESRTSSRVLVLFFYSPLIPSSLHPLSHDQVPPQPIMPTTLQPTEASPTHPPHTYPLTHILYSSIWKWARSKRSIQPIRMGSRPPPPIPSRNVKPPSHYQT